MRYHWSLLLWSILLRFEIFLVEDHHMNLLLLLLSLIVFIFQNSLQFAPVVDLLLWLFWLELTLWHWNLVQFHCFNLLLSVSFGLEGSLVGWNPSIVLFSVFKVFVFILLLLILDIDVEIGEFLFAFLDFLEFSWWWIVLLLIFLITFNHIKDVLTLFPFLRFLL